MDRHMNPETLKEFQKCRCQEWYQKQEEWEKEQHRALYGYSAYTSLIEYICNKTSLMFAQIFFTALLSYTAFAFYLYIKKYYRYWEKRGIPVENNFFFVSDLFKVFSGKLYFGKWAVRMYQKHNVPYFGFYVMGRPHLFIRDPEIIKSISIKNFNSFGNRSFYCDNKVDPVVAKSLFVAEYDQWRESRNKLNNLFSPAKLKSINPILSNASMRIQEYLDKHDNDIINFKEMAENQMTNVLLQTLFDVDSQCSLDKKECVAKEAIHNIFGRDWYQAFAFIAYCFVPKLVSWFNVKVANYDFLKDVALNAAKQKQKNAEKGRNISDLLANIAKENNKENGTWFDDNWLVSQGVTLTIAGFHPSSSLCALALYELSFHPEYQEKLRQEIKDSFSNETKDIPYEKVMDMKYLNMVICETLRKDLIGGFINRSCSQDCYIQEAGLKIEKGISIYASLDAIHIDPKYYPDPTKFDPDRFKDGTRKLESAGIFIPFGTGHRRCIGERFAILVAKVTLIHVLQKFRVEPCEFTEKPVMDPCTLGTSIINGVKLRVHKI